MLNQTVRKQTASNIALTDSQYEALARLDRAPGSLSIYHRVARPLMTYGLIELDRAAPTSDRAFRRYHITQPGRELVKRIRSGQNAN